MKINVTTLVLVGLLSASQSAMAFYAHINGPNYACPGSTLTYLREDDYGGGDVVLTVTNGEVFNEVTQTWVTSWSFYEGDGNWGTGFTPFQIRWSNAGGSGHLNVQVCDHTAT